MSITIYTDGSSRGNPGPGGWGAIIRTDKDVIELGGREDHTTNNRMELAAAINALVYIDKNDFSENIVVQSDSKYVIQGITQWVSGWQRNGWKTAAKKDVGNRDMWEALNGLASKFSIEWKYVAGHAGHSGNERCDEIATTFADKAETDLYQGPREKYQIDLDAKPSVSAISDSRKKAGKRSSDAKAYSYVSCVGGIIETHATWAECEARVKGKSGAKFKKAFSKEEEAEISSSFL